MTAPNHLTSPVYRQNYQRLEDVLGQPLPDLRPETVYRLRAEGFMDLVVEVLPRDPDTRAMVLSLCHYFELNGDLCQDPEMVVRLFPPQGDQPGRLEALAFTQAIPPVYSVAPSTSTSADSASTPMDLPTRDPEEPKRNSSKRPSGETVPRLAFIAMYGLGAAGHRALLSQRSAPSFRIRGSGPSPSPLRGGLASESWS